MATLIYEARWDYPEQLEPEGKLAYRQLIAKAMDVELISLIQLAWNLKFPPPRSLRDILSRKKTPTLKGNLLLTETDKLNWRGDHLAGELTLSVPKLGLRVELFYSNWGTTDPSDAWRVVYMSHGLRTDNQQVLIEHLRTRVLGLHGKRYTAYSRR